MVGKLSRYLFVFVTYIGAISAMRVNGHMIVDMLISKVNPKIQMLLYVVSQSLVAILMGILVHGSFKMVMQNTASRTAALGISYALLYSAGIITGVSIAIIAVTNIIHAITHPSEISQIVSSGGADDDAAVAQSPQDNQGDDGKGGSVL